MPLDTRSESKSVAATDPSPDRRGRRGARLAALAIAATAVGGAIYGGILSRVDAEKSLARTTSEPRVLYRSSRPYLRHHRAWMVG